MCKHDNCVELPFFCEVHQIWELRVIDACLAPLVFRLNNCGVKTTNSCCGHGQYQGTIIIDEQSLDRAYDLGYPVIHEVLAGGDYLGYAILC